MAQYINGVKLKKSKFGIKFSGKTEDLISQLQSVTNSKGYFNLEVKERKEEGKYGDTHYIQVDEYDPSKKEEEKKGDDLPF